MQVLKIDTGGCSHRGPLTAVDSLRAGKRWLRGISRIQKAGFTLLEVMVALAIMSIVLVSVYRMHSQTLAMNTAARFYTHAPLLAQGKLAELETNAAAMPAADSGDFGEEFPGYQWSVAADDLVSESLGDIGRDLKRIDVTVSLNNNEFVYNFRTYRFIRE